MIGETCFLYHRQLISYPTLLPSSKSSKNNQKATITVVVIQNGWVTSSSIRNVTACYGIINLSTELIQETGAFRAGQRPMMEFLRKQLMDKNNSLFSWKVRFSDVFRGYRRGILVENGLRFHSIRKYSFKNDFWEFADAVLHPKPFSGDQESKCLPFPKCFPVLLFKLK